MYSNSKETTRLHQHICWKHNKNNKLFKHTLNTWVDHSWYLSQLPFQCCTCKICFMASETSATYQVQNLKPQRKKRWEVQVGHFQTFPSHSSSSNLFFKTNKKSIPGRKHGYFFTWNSMISVTFMGSNRGIVIPTSFPPRHLGGCLLIAFLLLTSLSMQIIPSWDLVVFYKG